MWRASTPGSTGRNPLIRIKRTKTVFWADLAEEEYGSYEDHGRPEPPWDGGEDYEGEHAYNILNRDPFELRDAVEWDTISSHCLDNSIDKVSGNLGWGGCLDRREKMQMVSWLRWLRWLKDKIDKQARELGWEDSGAD